MLSGLAFAGPPIVKTLLTQKEPIVWGFQGPEIDPQGPESIPKGRNRSPRAGIDPQYQYQYQFQCWKFTSRKLVSGVPFLKRLSRAPGAGQTSETHPQQLCQIAFWYP